MCSSSCTGYKKSRIRLLLALLKLYFTSDVVFCRTYDYARMMDINLLLGLAYSIVMLLCYLYLHTSLTLTYIALLLASIPIIISEVEDYVRKCPPDPRLITVIVLVPDVTLTVMYDIACSHIPITVVPICLFILLTFVINGIIVLKSLYKKHINREIQQLEELAKKVDEIMKKIDELDNDINNLKKIVDSSREALLQDSQPCDESSQSLRD